MDMARIESMLAACRFEYHSRTENSVTMIHPMDLKIHVIIVDGILLVCPQMIGEPSKVYRRCDSSDLHATIKLIIATL